MTDKNQQKHIEMEYLPLTENIIVLKIGQSLHGPRILGGLLIVCVGLHYPRSEMKANL
jgi:hypothetical protein